MQLTGPHAQVITLMGPGVDPHLYKTTQGDLARLTEADVVFYNGLHLEGKMVELLADMAKRRPCVALAERLPADSLRHAPEFPAAHDPHVWFDILLWKQVAGAAAEELIRLDSAHAKHYLQRLAVYTARLDSLHHWVQDTLGAIAPDQRVLITAHDAFGYLGRRYGLEVRGLQGLSTQADFGLRDVANMVDFVVKRRLPALFIESSVSPRSIESVLEGCRARGHTVSLGGSLYSDALGPTGSGADSYCGMVTANVRTLVQALAPPPAQRP